MLAGDERPGGVGGVSRTLWAPAVLEIDAMKRNMRHDMLTTRLLCGKPFVVRAQLIFTSRDSPRGHQTAVLPDAEAEIAVAQAGSVGGQSAMTHGRKGRRSKKTMSRCR
jgi:hypothetical protein